MTFIAENRELSVDFHALDSLFIPREKFQNRILLSQYGERSLFILVGRLRHVYRVKWLPWGKWKEGISIWIVGMMESRFISRKHRFQGYEILLNKVVSDQSVFSTDCGTIRFKCNDLSKEAGNDWR